MISRREVLLVAGAGFAAQGLFAQSGFDHSHSAWTQLLKRHVVLLGDGKASQVRYFGMAADRAPLKRYLQSLSVVEQSTFEAWPSAQQQAFLINAYNAFTVELILSRYPDLKSIKDLGSFVSSPWKLQGVDLFGRKLSLDEIEHGLLRKPGAYDEPRVHFALNCASVGCPMLREEAYVANRLEFQLSQQTQRFMSDRSRNRWNNSAGRLELSKIFDWYGKDFRQGHRGIASLQAFAASHADLLADAPADRAQLRSGRFDIAFLDYDWSLNDASRTP